MSDTANTNTAGVSIDTLCRLSEPFPPAKVSWRIGNINKTDKTKATALCYIDARDVMERLDATLGPQNWRDSYVETARGRVICTIAVNVGGEWVFKSDGAGDTAVEGEKGGISDSFKRCAVKWGIGRYLYDIPQQRVKVNEWKQIERSEYAKLRAALPGSRIADEDDDHAPPARNDAPKPFDTGSFAAKDAKSWAAEFRRRIDLAPSVDALNAFVKNCGPTLKQIGTDDPDTFEALKAGVESRRQSLTPSVAAE